jgi:ribosomal protein S18 acetylase RimI-like enzyme
VDDPAVVLVDLSADAREPDVLALLAHAVGHPTADKLAALADRYAVDAAWRLWGERGADGRVSGLVGFTVDGGTAVIRHIAVAPGERGRGLGRRLVEALFELEPCAVLTAETDAEAVGFYRRCGFEVASLGDQRYPGVERFHCAGATAPRQTRRT